ncbi:MAG TPA: bZIP transcription factor [Niastella sp.]
MKKLVIIFGVLIAGSPFVSCKKLKDDIKDLQSQVNDLEKQNDTLKNHNSVLQEQLNGVVSSLGSNEPIAATTTFEDDNGVTRTISGVYKFKSTDYYTQKLVKNTDGTYEIYIERFGDLNWNEGAWVGFTYNPTTKAVTNISGGQYWSDADSYYDNARYSGTTTGLTMNVTIESLDVTTGATSLKFSASGTSAYTNAVSYWYVPNQGKPVSTTFSFAGKLKLFTQN